jgi:hypothetical protein
VDEIEKSPQRISRCNSALSDFPAGVTKKEKNKTRYDNTKNEIRNKDNQTYPSAPDDGGRSYNGMGTEGLFGNVLYRYCWL